MISNLDREFGQITDYWSPRVVADVNNQSVKLAKLKGEFVWHDHADEDELFFIVKGSLTIQYRDREMWFCPPENCMWFPKAWNTTRWLRTNAG